MTQVLAKLRRPRWFIGLLVVIVISATFVGLGLWQLSRLDDRREANEALSAALAAAPIRLAELDAAASGSLTHQMIEAEGAWLGDLETELLLQSRKGQAGVHIITPFEQRNGRVILVDRGFAPLDQSDDYSRAFGEAAVAGRLMQGSSDGRFITTRQERPAVSRVDLDLIGSEFGLDLPDFYLVLMTSDPPVAGLAPEPAPPPRPEEGRHLLYAIQWFSFAGIALVGYVLLVHRRG